MKMSEMMTDYRNYWDDPFYETGKTITGFTGSALDSNYVTTSNGTTNVYIDEMINDLVYRKLKGEDIVSEKKEKIIKKVPKEFQIKQVVFNEKKNATTVLFKDGKHVVVKRSENEWSSDIYNVVAYAIAKKIYGSNSAFKKALKEKTTLIRNKKKTKVDPDTLEV